MSSNFSISEEFDNRQGRLMGYDAYDGVAQAAIAVQQHVDLRSFRQNDIAGRLTMFDLELLSMSDLEALTMSGLEGIAAIITAGEHWTAGVVGPQSDRQNWLGLSLALAVGANETKSVMPAQPVDISTGFVGSDVLSVALPAFPLPSITTATSFIDLTSNASGDFAAGPTASLAFSTSSVALVNGDSEFRVPLSAITGIDKTKITGVRFRVTATGSATFRVTGIRALAASWTYGPLDLDTRYGLLRNTPSRAGDLSTTHAYAQPTLWHSGLTGAGDPEPINAKMGVVFNTGTATADSRISLYFRETTKDFTTMLDLDGLTMDELDGNPQPDFGTTGYLGRPQSDLDTSTQGGLDGITQTRLERIPDPSMASWIEFNLHWGSASYVSILDTAGGGYNTLGPLTLSPNTFYLWVVELVDTTARAYVYELDNSGSIVATKFDTGLIFDSFTFTRNSGRFGWSAALGDGDSYIDNLRSRGLVFAEYRSRPLESITPVTGVELFAAGSSAVNLFENFGPYNTTQAGVVERDKTHSTTGESWRITNLGNNVRQGVKSDPLFFSDFENSEIYFDLFFPKNAMSDGSPISAYLKSTRGNLVPLVIERVIGDQWQTHHVVITNTTIQTGYYQLLLLQNSINVPATWWVDNVRIYERTLRWQARVDRDDPWDEADGDWIDFKDAYNRESAGIMFGDRGNKIQVRGQALGQTAFINKVKFRPRYAELGRLVDPNATLGFPPAGSFASTDLGSHKAHLDATASADTGFILSYEWTFGDGEIGYGQIVEHQYETGGIYQVSLVVTDDNGNHSVVSNPITIA